MHLSTYESNDLFVCCLRKKSFNKNDQQIKSIKMFHSSISIIL